MICIPLVLAGGIVFVVVFVAACVFYSLGHEQKRQDREHRDRETARYVEERASTVVWIALALNEACRLDLIKVFEREEDALHCVYGLKSPSHTYVRSCAITRPAGGAA